MFGFCIVILAIIIGFTVSLYGLVQSFEWNMGWSYKITFMIFFLFYLILVVRCIFYIFTLI